MSSMRSRMSSTWSFFLTTTLRSGCITSALLDARAAFRQAGGFFARLKSHEEEGGDFPQRPVCLSHWPCNWTSPVRESGPAGVITPSSGMEVPVWSSRSTITIWEAERFR